MRVPDVCARFAAPLHLPLLGLLCATATPAFAREGPSKRAILEARDEVFARSEFAAAPEKGKSFILEIAREVMDTIGRFRQEHPIAYIGVMVVLVLALVILVAHIVWTLAVARRASYDDEPELPELDLRRTPPAEFRRRAVALADQGKYEDAARELYVALLLALDARGDVTYARHKALLDYRLEARRSDARAALDLFAGGYHPASFGRRTLRQDRFEELLNALDAVAGSDAMVAPRGASA